MIRINAEAACAGFGHPVQRLRRTSTVSRHAKEKDYYLSERRYGSFTRSFRVPDGVDADKIAASFTKGVLTVKLPKTAEVQSKEKKIAVTAA